MMTETETVTPEVIHAEISSTVNKLGCVSVEKMKTDSTGVRLLLRRNDKVMWNRVVLSLLQEKSNYADMLEFDLRIGTHAFIVTRENEEQVLAYAAYIEVEFKDAFKESGEDWAFAVRQFRAMVNNVRLRAISQPTTSVSTARVSEAGAPKTSNAIEIPANLVRNPKMLRLTRERVSLTGDSSASTRVSKETRTTNTIKQDSYDGPSNTVGFVRTGGAGGNMTIADHVNSLRAYETAHTEE